MPLDTNRAKIDVALGVQCRQRRRRLRARQQHGMAQMRAAARMRQDMRQQQALVDFQTLLCLQRQGGLGGKLRPRRHQSGIGFGAPA